MNTVTLKIIGSIPLGGKAPGYQWEEPADEKGNPISQYWRKRLADEAKYNIGAVEKVAKTKVETKPIKKSENKANIPALEKKEG